VACGPFVTHPSATQWTTTNQDATFWLQDMLKSATTSLGLISGEGIAASCLGSAVPSVLSAGVTFADFSHTSGCEIYGARALTSVVELIKEI